MSWKDLTVEHRQHLEHTLTSNQVDALILHLAGCSQQRAADMLGISRRSYRDRLHVGVNAMAELARKDAA